MRLKYCFYLLGCLMFLFASCSSPGGDNGVPFVGTIVSDLIGNWEASRAQFTTVHANPIQVSEVIAMGGTGTLVVASDARFTLVITPLGENPQITTGQFGVANNSLTVVFDNEPAKTVLWTIQSATNTNFLVGPIKYDFENDGTVEEATVELDLIKN